jgi:hypothetical protein
MSVKSKKVVCHRRLCLSSDRETDDFDKHSAMKQNSWFCTAVMIVRYVCTVKYIMRRSQQTTTTNNEVNMSTEELLELEEEDFPSENVLSVNGERATQCPVPSFIL